MEGTKSLGAAYYRASSEMEAEVEKVFFITAPHEDENRGDTDYVEVVRSALKKYKSTQTVFVKGNIVTPELYDAGSLYKTVEVNGRNDPAYKQAESVERKAAVERLKWFITSQVTPDLESSTAIHLQLRSPETGCMIHPDEIPGLKECVGKFFVTCHEWLHIPDQERRKQLEYIVQADGVMFLNQRDMDEAKTLVATEGRMLTSNVNLSNVIATLPTSIESKDDALQKSGSRMLVFGLMRKDKGFEEAIELSRQGFDITFAGKPHDIKVLEEIVRSKKIYNGDLKVAATDSYRLEVIAAYMSEKCVTPGMEPQILEALFRINADQTSASLFDKLHQNSARLESILGVGFLQSHSKNIKSKTLAPLPKEDRLRYTVKFLKDIGCEHHGLYLDINAEQLDELAKQHRYCIKLEGKEFANNSSSMINALSRFLFIFTYKGELTSQEFMDEGKYARSVCLLEKPTQRTLISEEMVDQIKAKISELASPEKWEEAVTAMGAALNELFSAEKIAEHHTQMYGGI